MLINFKNVSDEETVFDVLPEGQYNVKVVSCEEKTSTKGNSYWAIKYETANGDTIFDNLVFTEKTFNRVKKLFKTLGLDVEGEFDYKPSDIIDCYMKAEVLIESYTDKTGKERTKNVIDLWNCESLKATKKAPKKVVKEESDELPF